MSDGDNQMADALQSIVGWIEEKQAQRDQISQDIAELYRHAKSDGFSVPVIRQLIRERRMDPVKRAETYSLLEEYRQALGMLADTPLGRYAEPDEQQRYYAREDL